MGNYDLEDLEVYKKAREFRKKMYLLIKELPSDENFNLVSLIRRAATSLTNNIAEGHGRFHYQENIQFVRQSHGSLEELIDDINICMDEKYVPTEKTEELKQEAKNLLHLMNGYIAYLKRKKESNND